MGKKLRGESHGTGGSHGERGKELLGNKQNPHYKQPGRPFHFSPEPVPQSALQLSLRLVCA